MPNISNKEKKHLVQLLISEDKYQQIKRAAESVDEPVTGWIRRAAFAALRRWSPPKPNADNWEPCPMCHKKHDPQEHLSKDSE